MFFERVCLVCGATAEVLCMPCGGLLRPLTVEPGSNRRARFELEPTVREVVAAFKYRRERRLAHWAADQLEPLVPSMADTITWCPATPGRVRQRGFDQGRELACRLARTTGIPARATLRRNAADERQTRRGVTERRLGPDLEAREPAQGLVVLIDDITTTGGTLDAAERALLSAGADRVVAVTLAATPRRRG